MVEDDLAFATMVAQLVREEGGHGRGRHYVAEVLINGEKRGAGKGTSKKTAEQDAAQSAFRSMRSRKPHGPRHGDRPDEPQRDRAR